MTKDQTIAFLTEAGNVATAEQIGDDYHRITFRHRGTRLSVLTCEDDEVFLVLQCSYGLRYAITEELEAYRTVGRLQARYKVVKFAFEVGEARVIASMEQFVPQGDAFEGLFWRSVELITCAAEHAARDLNTTVAANAAARKFTEELEVQLAHIDIPKNDSDSRPLP